MTLDKFTIKAQESVQEAINTAQRNGQQTIESGQRIEYDWFWLISSLGFDFFELSS